MQSIPRRALDTNPLRQEIIFGGEKGAQTVPKGAGPGLPVDAAKKLEASGAKAPEIFQQTGWYRGPDGAWKWTLSDKGASLKDDAFQTFYTGDPTGLSKEDLAKDAQVRLKRGGPEGTRKLTDILDHPALYETYPEFKNTTVKVLPPLPGGGVGGGTAEVGSYDAANNVLNIRDFRSAKDVLSTILHEVQHGVQSTEGFGTGLHWNAFLPSDVRTGKRRPTQEEQDYAIQNYFRVAGETEARQVEKQFQTQNWSQRPTQMEGFPTPEQQWVRQGNATSLPPGKSYQFEPVDHDPFNDPQVRPVEHDPFTAPNLTPVDYDPFATMEGVNAAYTKAGQHVYNTPLEPQAEEAFRGWVQQNNVPFDPEAGVTDYDMRGFWLGLHNNDPRAVSAIDPHDEKLHYPDNWKTPLHQTFSADSQWATSDAPRWTPEGQLIDNQGNVVFAPPSPNAGALPYQPVPAEYHADDPSTPMPGVDIPYEDLSRDDVVRRPWNPSSTVGRDNLYSWGTGEQPPLAYPTSPYTNPFVTPEYGWQSSPSNPVLSDAPPEIPPPYSPTRGEHSQYQPSPSELLSQMQEWLQEWWDSQYLEQRR